MGTFPGMNEEKSNDTKGDVSSEQPSRRHGPRRTLDVVISDDQRREDRRKSKPGWKKLLEIVFGGG